MESLPEQASYDSVVQTNPNHEVNENAHGMQQPQAIAIPVTNHPTPSSSRNLNYHTTAQQFFGGARGKSLSAKSPGTASKTKRKSGTPKNTNKKRKSIDLSTTSENIFSNDELEETESNIDGSTNILEESVEPFTIHRLNLSKLRFLSKKIMNEKEMIALLMEDVNKKYSGSKYEKAANPFVTDTSAPNFDYLITAYVQTIIQQDKLLLQLNISRQNQRINKIVFYHREEEIYAITTGQTWQVIQSYSCYKFPHIIAERIANPDGSYEETNKPLTGNEKKRKTIMKNATLFDQLNHIRYSAVKEIRATSSIYRLQEFRQTPTSTSSTQEISHVDRYKLTIGMAYIRIQKKMKLHNFPELLVYFSKIYKTEDTFSYPDGELEKDCGDIPLIRPTSSKIYTDCETYLHKMIHNFLHNCNQDLIKELDLCDKYVDNFSTATGFTLKYITRNTNKIIEKFDKIPLAVDCFRAIKRNCEKVTNAKKFAEFQAGLVNRIKLEYTTVTGTPVERKFVDLIECEINFNDTHYIKMLGNWWELSEDYFFQLHQMFQTFLTKDGLLMSQNDTGFLANRWNETMSSSTHYVQSYQNMDNYFIPGNAGENGNQSLETNFMWDLMKITGEENGPHSVILYYIFERFDPKIRGASTRLEKSLQMLIQKENKPDEKLNQSLAEVYSSQRSIPRFMERFQSQGKFRQAFQGKVTVVAAFRTSIEEVNAEQHLFMTPQQWSASTTTRRARSLHDEKNLKLSFNVTNIQHLVVDALPEQHRIAICTEMGISQNGIAAKILKKLLENRFCHKTPEPAHIDKPVSGKLLKYRSAKDFKLLQNQEVNKKIFQLIQPHFITHFPGILHKLEVNNMHNITVTHSSARLDFKIMEILDS